MVKKGGPAGSWPPGSWALAIVAGAVVLSVASVMGEGGLRFLAPAVALALAAAYLVSVRRLGHAQAALERSQADYRHLVDLPAQATFVSDASGRFLFVSERYTAWTGLDLQAGEPDWVAIIHPDDREAVIAGWTSSLATGNPHDQEHRVRHLDGRYRWKRARAWPQLAGDGSILRWVGQIEDIHERWLAEQQLRQTASLLEMIGSSTDSIIWAKDQEGRMLYVNRALERLAGVTLADVLGKLDSEWNPNRQEAEAFAAADRRVLESGMADDVEEAFTGHGGTLRHYRSIRSPLRDRTGKVIGSVGIATDITERREAEERERLLARELDHRAKNLLAVVQSVVTLTRAATVQEYKAAIEGRIESLGRAHSMLAASRWEGADLKRIVTEELAPFAGAGGGEERVVLDGPPLLLRPAAAQSLALVIHELVTNAVKYGALSQDKGRLDVTWQMSGADRPGTGLRLVWSERGGPPVAARNTDSPVGFGTRLIRSSIERQLGGRLHLDWAEAGLAAVIELPIERSLWSPHPPGPEEQSGHGPALRQRTRRKAA